MNAKDNSYYVLVIGPGEEHTIPEQRREETLSWQERDERPSAVNSKLPLARNSERADSYWRCQQ